jgi:tetratricopeptide (TPR) repeat protein
MDMPMPTQACGLAKLSENGPEPPLYPGIGSAHWHVPWAQDYFDQGLRFYFGFNNRESYRAFHKAAAEAEDKGIPCSACYWAQALVLGVDLNMPKQSPPDLQEAHTMLQRARDASPNPEDLEIIQALSKRYQDCNPSDSPRQCQGARNEGYYDGMKSVLKDFGSDDPNVITLFADAAMNITPWAYWKGGNPVSERIAEAKDQLERALNFVQYPRNEGPIHWYIHLMEQSPTPSAAKPYADLLASLAPNAGHLVHMPSHIYYRIGDMQNAIRANKEAIEADERYFAVEPDLYRPDDDRYITQYYLHNFHMLIAAAMLSGDNQDINRYAEKMLQAVPGKGNGSGADAYRTVYYLAKVNFSSTADIRRFAPPGPINQQPLANIAYDYTQLMADIWDKKDPQQSVRKFDDDFAQYGKDQSEKKRDASCVPVPEVQLSGGLCLPAILNNLGHAQVAASNTNWVEADAAAVRASKIQDALRYTEPPMWPYPAGQTLASILIRKADVDGLTTEAGRGDLVRARDLLLDSLNKSSDGNPKPQIPTTTFPGNGWAYYGLWEIAKRDGSSPGDIAKARAELDGHWLGSAEFQNLDRM